MQGNFIVSKSLKDQGLEYCFGIVGFPVIELGYAIQSEGIQYFGCRNEQGASYSAGAIGYLTRRPGICLVVSGPGMIHGMAGIANAWANNWPMILIAGASPQNQDGRGSFQESDQMILAKPYCKYSYKVPIASLIPFHIERAVRLSMQGRPGPVYIVKKLELPDDVLTAVVEEKDLHFPLKFDVENIDKCLAHPKNVIKHNKFLKQKIDEALQLLLNAKKPLVIIGKGAQYVKAEKEMLQFVNLTQIPFLPTPMGKGLIDDEDVLCVGPARSTALGQADVILLVGARLNWILHYGLPPRFQKDVKIIQIDIHPEEFHTNIRSAVNLFGDLKCVLEQFNEQIIKNSVQFPGYQEWKKTLEEKKKINIKQSQDLMLDNNPPLQYYSALHIINKHLPKNFIHIGEGANTMDIARTIVNQRQPRTKLDAASYGTMGIGIPFALASKIYYKDRPVVAIQGDSAFGFSCMELETASRYNLPITVFIINNNGIGRGVEELEAEKGKESLSFPPNCLKPDTRYEKIAEAFGGEGIFVKTHQELEQACIKVFKNPNKLYIVNVMISPSGNRKPQEHNWLTKAKL